jgi:hypothetical protein
VFQPVYRLFPSLGQTEKRQNLRETEEEKSQEEESQGILYVVHGSFILARQSGSFIYIVYVTSISQFMNSFESHKIQEEHK